MDSSPVHKVHKRKLRNYVLDKRFQFKYTGMVVAVTLVVASALGALAYRYSVGQTEALTASIAAEPDLNPEAAEDLVGFAAQKDREVLAAIILGVLILTIAIGLTGIIITHRVVGPAYRMKKLFSDLGDGHMQLRGSIRKGDELQDLFDKFAVTVDSLRAMQSADVAQIDEAIQALQQDDSQKAIEALEEVLVRIRARIS